MRQSRRAVIILKSQPSFFVLVLPRELRRTYPYGDVSMVLGVYFTRLYEILAGFDMHRDVMIARDDRAFGPSCKCRGEILVMRTWYITKLATHGCVNAWCFSFRQKKCIEHIMQCLTINHTTTDAECEVFPSHIRARSHSARCHLWLILNLLSPVYTNREHNAARLSDTAGDNLQ